MPNRRRTARKLKRAINKAKAKVKRTQQPTDTAKNPNVDMMKLMALLAGGGKQSAMDPQSLLNTREKISELQNENMKIKDASKMKIADEKLKREQMKNEMEQMKNEYEDKLEQAKTDKVKKDLEHQKKMQELGAEKAGLVGKLGELMSEIEDAQNNIIENRK